MTAVSLYARAVFIAANTFGLISMATFKFDLKARDMRKVSDGVTLSITGIPSLTTCVDQCMATSNDARKCKFINFNSQDAACEIFDVYSAVGELVHEQGWNHWELRVDDCSKLRQQGKLDSGVYSISTWFGTVPVFCDMSTNGGGWTVLQTRLDGSEDFYRTWQDYKIGFGSVEGEYWSGNDVIHYLTSGQPESQLVITMQAFDGNISLVFYAHFSVADESTFYQLSVGGFDSTKSTTGDNLGFHNGMFFSTYDSSHDESPLGDCPVRCKGGWWYRGCHQANLNGFYWGDRKSEGADGMTWLDFRGYYSLKRTEMKVRPAGFV